MSSVSMTYDGYTFEPVPIINLSKNFVRNQGDEVIGTLFSLTLNGHLVETTGGLNGIMDQQYNLREGLNEDCKTLTVTCGGDIVLEVKPRILSINFEQSPDQWTKTTPYTVELEFDLEENNDENTELHNDVISEYNDSWTIEFLEDRHWHDFITSAGSDAPPYQLRVSHDVSAKGKKYCGDTTLDAWEQARNFVATKLGYQHDKVKGPDIINISDNWNTYDHIRNQVVNETEGTYSCTESWLVIDQTIAGISVPAIEDFTIEARINREDSSNFVSIQGTIEGLAQISYSPSYNIIKTKYSHAEDYWTMVADSLRILPRAQAIATQHGFTLNVNPTTKTVTHSPSQGTISYNYEYDDTSNCIDGAKSEVITITDTRPTDIFASLTVLGRSAGNLLQDLGTSTNFRREINIEVVMEKDDDCPDNVTEFFKYNSLNPSTQVEAILCNFEEDLQSTYGQVFKDNDVESWNPSEARYSRNISWTCANCSTANVTELTCA